MSHVFPVGDLNGDGRLDLAAIQTVAKYLEPTPPGQPKVPAGSTGEIRIVRLNRWKSNYHWKQIRPRAQRNRG